jgi:hypothetical protein
MTTIANKISYTWSTKKNEDGTFTGIVEKLLHLDQPINGYYVLTAIEKRIKTKTRATAKSKAIEWVRYYKSQLNK